MYYSLRHVTRPDFEPQGNAFRFPLEVFGARFHRLPNIELHAHPAPLAELRDRIKYLRDRELTMT